MLQPISKSEHKQAFDKLRTKPDLLRRREEIIGPLAEKIAEEAGIPIEQARDRVNACARGDLYGKSIIDFEDFGMVSVEDIVRNTGKYNLASCRDPGEPEEGYGKATLFANQDGVFSKPVLYSFLHGGCNYFLHSGSVEGGAGRGIDEVISEISLLEEKSHEACFSIIHDANLQKDEENTACAHVKAVTGLPFKRVYNSMAKEARDARQATCAAEELQRVAAGKRLVEYNKLTINAVVEEAEAGIIEIPGRWSYFNYGGMLGLATYDKPTWRATGVENKEPPDVPVIKPYSHHSLALRMEQSVLFYTLDKSGNEPKKKLLPTQDQIVYKLINHPEPQAPIVSGLISHPVVTRDGRIISKEGIDTGTRLIAQFGGERFTFSSSTSQLQAERNINTIVKTILSEFKLGTENEFLAVAMILTAISRKVIDLAPGFLITANTPGSGKTTLVRMIHVILTGQDLPVSTLGSSSDEMKKEVLAALLQSPAMICYDNLLDGTEIKDATISKILTSGFFKGRKLGVSQELKVPTNTVLTFTGNNITIAADLIRRFLTIKLHVDVERPELRSFENKEIVQHCLNSREKMIRMSVGIIHGYIAAGSPLNESGNSSGFSQWDEMVRFPIMWATDFDVLTSMDKNREESTELQAIAGVSCGLYDHFGETPFTASEVLRLIDKDFNTNEIEILRENFEMVAVKSLRSSKSLAWTLKKISGRIIEDKILKTQIIGRKRREFFFENTG